MLDLVPAYAELAADAGHDIGVQAELGRAPGRELDQSEGGRPAAIAAGLPAALGFPLCLAAEVPDVIRRTGHTAQRALGRSGAVFNSVSICEKHMAGRSSVPPEVRSRARQAFARLAGSLFVAQTVPFLKHKGAPPPRPERRGFRRGPP